MRSYAQIMWKLGYAALVLPLLFVAPLHIHAQEFTHPEAVVPGSILPVRIEDVLEDNGGEGSKNKSYEVFWAELYRVDEEKPIVRGRSFDLRGDDRSVIILGIPNTTETGEYRLAFYGGHDDGANTDTAAETMNEKRRRFISSAKLRIDSRSFGKEEIPLRKSLSTLRREPDPRKTEQARTILALYDSFDTEAVHSLELWAVPVEYKYITSRFGDRRVYRYDDGSSARSIHTGVDLAAATGTPVRAPAAGRVVLAKNRVISGKSLVLEHLPGLYSVYFHLDSIGVELADSVERGELLGTVGMSGLATGPHLHWEVRVQGVPIDPWVLTKRSIFEIIFATTEELPRGPSRSEGG